MTKVADSLQDYNDGIVICPECNTICSDQDARALFEPISGIVLGYMLTCHICHKNSFINMLGKPPLFDLSGRYAYISGKEG